MSTLSSNYSGVETFLAITPPEVAWATVTVLGKLGKGKGTEAHPGLARGGCGVASERAGQFTHALNRVKKKTKKNKKKDEPRESSQTMVEGEMIWHMMEEVEGQMKESVQIYIA